MVTVPLALQGSLENMIQKMSVVMMAELDKGMVCVSVCNVQWFWTRITIFVQYAVDLDTYHNIYAVCCGFVCN
jgi:hypothetical protein